MNVKALGIVVIVLGLIMTLYTGFNYVTREKVVEIGDFEISADKQNTAIWSPWIGVGIIVIGGVVFLAGKKK